MIQHQLRLNLLHVLKIVPGSRFYNAQVVEMTKRQLIEAMGGLGAAW